MGVEVGIPVALTYTDTGALTEAFIPLPDDGEVVENPCVWCDGLGVAGGGADEEELYYFPSLMTSSCQACRGTGVSGKTTKGELRKKAYDDRVWFIDARRAEQMSYDICPNCRVGGCTEWCWMTDADWVCRVADVLTGEETVIWADPAFRFDATFRAENEGEEPSGLAALIAIWEEDMTRAMRHLNDEIIGM